MIIFLFLLTFVIGGFCSYLILREVGWAGRLLFQVPAVIVIGLLDAALGRMATGHMHPFMVMLWTVVAVAPSFPLLGNLMGNVVLAFAREMMSDGHLKVRPTYDKAEAAMHRREYDEAEKLFQQAARETPDDPEVHRRLAKLYVVWGRIDDAVAEHRAVYARVTRPEDKYLAAFDCAELLAENGRDVPGAIAVIEKALAEWPDHPSARFARERLNRLRERG